MNSAKIMIAGGVLAVGLSAATGVMVWRNQQVARQWAQEKAAIQQKADQAAAEKQAALAMQVAQVAAGIQANGDALRDLRPGLAQQRNEVLKLQGVVEDLAVAPVSLPVLTAEQVARLPKKFRDELVYPGYWNVDIKREEKRIPFVMILVPGDAAKGIAPFYMGETEVSWDLFKTWAHSEDLGIQEYNEEVMKKLRPSNDSGYNGYNHMMGYEGMPAMSMSRLTAEKFCDFLSKRTGRHYRLPTEAEWDRAYALGGGDPPDQAGKLEAAWCKENSDDCNRDEIDIQEKIFMPRVGKVATTKPNALGLYDMLGNVAEWVKTPGKADTDGKNTFVRGGDYLTPVAQLSGARREESDNRCNMKASWNYTYPQNPCSIWWYKDHFQIGFRLVCDPVNLPAAKP